MSIWLIGGMVVGGWALLSLIGSEHARLTQDLNRRARHLPAPEGDTSAERSPH